MLDRRWLKMWRDAWLNKMRSALVLTAIAVALCGAGALLDTWALVRGATTTGYAASLPVSATLDIEHADRAVVEIARGVPGVAAARVRRAAWVSLQGGGGWRRGMIFALEDFDSASLGRLRSEVGTWPPADGELVLERSSLEFSEAALGENVALARDGGDPVALRVSGIARDVSLAPGWMEHVVYGFATAATLERLGIPAGYDELQIRVADARADRDAVRRIAYAVKAAAERGGYRVSDVAVPEPGRHVHAAQMDSMLMTQGAFAILTLIVCGFLIVNLIAAMLAGQAREIGVLKALGASAGQIAWMYLGFALLLGVAASVIAIPAALAIGRRYAAFRAEMLNFPLDMREVPWLALLAQLAVGALLPIVAAAAPLRSVCRAPVASALRATGISTERGGHTLHRAIRFGGTSRLILLSIDNAFRRRQRMVLTLLALAAGGAVHIGAANLRAAVKGSVDELYAAQHFDVSLRPVAPQPAVALERAARAVDGITRAEAWSNVRALRTRPDGTSGDRFALAGLPPDSALLTPRVTAGRWLADTDRRALVAGRSLVKDDPAYVVGAEVELAVDGVVGTWTVVGIADSGPQAVAYAPRATLEELRGERANALLVATASRNPASQLDAIARLRDALDAAGMPIASSQRTDEQRRVIEDHLLLVVRFLGLMGWVMVAVGGMGLASTMGLAVLERTREIGVLRALGARHRAIVAMVQVEALVIALLAWLAAMPLSVPMSVALGAAFGRVMFPVPLRLLPDAWGVGGWLLVVVPVALFAAAWPAWRATRVPAAVALQYE